jgi:hypothetical protein
MINKPITFIHQLDPHNPQVRAAGLINENVSCVTLVTLFLIRVPLSIFVYCFDLALKRSSFPRMPDLVVAAIEELVGVHLPRQDKSASRRLAAAPALPAKRTSAAERGNQGPCFGH